MFDVNRGKHSLVGMISASVSALHSRALPAFNDQPRNRFVGEDHAVMRFDETRQRLRQFPRSAFREGSAVALLVERAIGYPAGHRILRRLLRPRTGQHERAAVLVLEIVADDFPVRHTPAALPKLG